MAFLHIYVGNMMSNKTSSLIRELVVDASIGLNVLYINHSLDERSPTIISTHNPMLKLDCDLTTIKFIKTDKLSTVDISKYDVIGIDEAQFFADLYSTVKQWVDTTSKKVVVVGLDGTSQREKFGQILDLIPLCDTVTKLTAYCKRCANSNPRKLIKAPFTHRFSDDSSVICVGGSNLYEPVCRSCYLELNRNS